MSRGPRNTINDRLKAFRSRVFFQVVHQALHEAADLVKAEAQHSITTGSASGQVKGSKHKHQPSAPGTPPNNFSGHLAKNIEVSQPEFLTARVTSHAAYSGVHEFGSSTHPARPFMRPARDKTRRAAAALLKKRINQAKRKR